MVGGWWWTVRESNPRHPPCEGGGLPLTYPSLLVRWGVVESNHIVPRHRRGAVTVWLTPHGRRGRARAPSGAIQPPTACVSCRCASVCATRRWSQERSNLLLPGFNRPLHRQSFRTVVSPGDPTTGGARPCGHHVTGEGTPGLRIGRDGAGGGDRTRWCSGTGRVSYLQDLAGRGWAEGIVRRRAQSNPRLRRGAPTCCPLTPRPQGSHPACSGRDRPAMPAQVPL